MNDLKGVIEDDEQAIRLSLQANSRNISAWYGSLQANLQDLDRKIGLNSQKAELYWQRGEIRYLLSDYQGALQDYNQALNFQPEDAKGYLKRATIHVILRNLNAAIADYNQALQRDPQFNEAYLGRIAARRILSGNTVNNIKDIEKVLSLKPDALGLHIKLAQPRSQTGNERQSE